MPVTPRHAGTRVVGEAAHAELGRSQSLPREPPLHWRVPRAEIAKLVEVLLRPVGHPETLAPGPPQLVSPDCETGGRDGGRGAAGQRPRCAYARRRRGGTWRRACASSRAVVGGAGEAPLLTEEQLLLTWWRRARRLLRRPC